MVALLAPRPTLPTLPAMLTRTKQRLQRHRSRILPSRRLPRHRPAIRRSRKQGMTVDCVASSLSINSDCFASVLCYLPLLVVFPRSPSLIVVCLCLWVLNMQIARDVVGQQRFQDQSSGSHGSSASTSPAWSAASQCERCQGRKATCCQPRPGSE